MRIYNFSEIKPKKGKLKYSDQLLGALKFGFSWPKKMAAQSKFLAILDQSVDQRFSAFQNYPISDTGVEIPLLFVGPPGIRVIMLTQDRGMYRAQESHWLELSGKQFRPAKINLIRQTQLYIRAVQKMLEELQYPDIVVDGLIVGMDPGVHVDTQRPEIRVIQYDALRNLGKQLTQEEPLLSPEKVYHLVTALIQATETPEPEKEEVSLQNRAEALGLDKFPENLEPLQKKMNFNTQQWVILALLFIGTVAVLLVFMFVILLSL